MNEIYLFILFLYIFKMFIQDSAEPRDCHSNCPIPVS